ncbi:MAG: sensor histidine kinase [Sphaerochaetaceae bacterium]|jgi:two-component system sensor histidine kinase YesM
MNKEQSAKRLSLFNRFVQSQYSIRTKLVIMHLLAAIIPLVVIAFISYMLTFNAMKESAVQSFFTTADQLNANIELLLLDSKSFLRIARTDEVQNFLYHSDESETQFRRAFDVVELFKSYRKLFDFSSYIANVVILNKAGPHISEHRGIFTLPVDIEELDIVKEINKQPDGISIIPSYDHSYMLSEGTQPYLSVGAVIYKNVTHEELGYIIVNLQMDALVNLVEALTTQQEGDFFIVEHLDNFVYPLEFSYEQAMLPQHRVDEITQQTRGFFSESFLGIPSFFVFNTLDLTDWKIIGRSNQKDLLAHAMTIRNTSILALGIVITLSFLLYLFISNRVTRPIRQLQEAMIQVGKGDWNLQPVSKSKDEIADLAHSFTSMVKKIQMLLETTKEEQHLAKEMEFRALQAQINPHFLYNSLESIVWMAEGGKKEEIITMTKSLSYFYRLSLAKGDYKVSIKDELSHIEHYLIIQKLRYRDILSFEIDVPEHLYAYSIIKIILQPIVENAIYHGIKNTRDAGLVKIVAYEDGDAIVFEVQDNGKGMTKEKVHELQNLLSSPLSTKSFVSSYGLRNIHQRLQLDYGEHMGLHITSEIDVGTTVYIRIAKELYVD